MASILAVHRWRYWVIILVSLIGLYLPSAPNTYAAVTLLWKPYLQQLTDTSVIILWVTQTGANPEVHYSSDTSFSSVVVGSTHSTIGATQLHRVELTGLQPNTHYNYKIYIDGEELLVDESLSFQTAPPIGSSTPSTFLVFGDYGRNSTSQQLLRDQMLLDSFNFILTTGDNAYNSGSYIEFDNNVFKIYQDLFTKVGLFPSLGNHDYRTDNAAPYLDIFELPQNAWQSGSQERYYSFDFGNVHFVVLDSNDPLRVDDATAGNDMFDWLRNDLAQTPQPWKVVAFHHAAYSPGLHGSDSDVQSKLVPIFEQYGVDLVLNGHDHIYSRTHPLRNGQLSTTANGGIIYVVSGSGSRADYSCGSAPYWLAISYCSQSYGIYNRITINGNNLTLEAIDDTGATKDTYAINKNFAVPPSSLAINGPVTSLEGVKIELVAAISPVTTSLPITYTWQATEQLSQTVVGGLENNAIYTWQQTGTKIITVTATNRGGATVYTQTISINEVASTTYLPVIIKP